MEGDRNDNELPEAGAVRPRLGVSLSIVPALASRSAAPIIANDSRSQRRHDGALQIVAFAVEEVSTNSSYLWGKNYCL